MITLIQLIDFFMHFLLELYANNNIKQRMINKIDNFMIIKDIEL